MNKFVKILRKLKIVRSFESWLDKISLPGFEGNSILQVGKFFIKSAFSEELNLRSGYLAFSFFLALFPAIIFLFTIIPYLPFKNLDIEILKQMELVLPKNVFETLNSTIKDIVQNKQGGLLSLGAISAIYFSSNGFMSMIHAFNSHRKRKTSPIKDRIKSIVLTIIVSIILILSVIIIVFTSLSISWIKSKGFIDSNIITLFYNALEYLSLLLLFIIVFSSLYFIGSSLSLRWNFFSPGSILSSFLSFGATELFTYYVNNFNSYNKLYGSIGTIISLMLLIYFNSMIILIGFELNYSIYKASKEKNSNFS
ncbi:MAG: YihY/virulence factor BrkB family protein [Bacteroidetes bacterium]|nr:YihY/virulence factor BrkB family protein [Bacteroidota bacterium]